MKKATFIVALLLTMAVSAKAQWFDFSNNKRFSIGFNIGVVGYDLTSQGIDKTYSGFGTGINISAGGVYLDFIHQSPEHKWGNKITPDMYRDHTALAINVGYQFPVLSWLYVTPLIGYSNQTVGWTDCSTLNVNQENRSIYHDYDYDEIYHHFNYGVGLMLRPIDVIEIGVMATSHALYGTISYSASAKK